jgi:hypothetical protein
MTMRTGLINLGKLILAALGYEAGTILGGMVVTLLNLPAPTPPPGADMDKMVVYMLYITPLYALALAILASHLKGGFVARWLSLSFLVWIAYTVNTQLEAAIVSSYATGRAFAIVSGAFAALLGGASVAWLFPPKSSGFELGRSIKRFFGQRSVAAWAWRLLLAAVIFTPIYFAFGLMVLPFTGAYYQEQMFGLAMPTIDQLLPTLLTRSILFLLAALPILVMWGGKRLGLFWRLGLSLFMLVGFNIMLIATWLPVYVRFPHTLEILADEFLYAGALVWLLVPRSASEAEPMPSEAGSPSAAAG